MMFRNLLFAAMALVVLAFGMEPDTYSPKTADSPKTAAQHATATPSAAQPSAGSILSSVIG